MPLGSIVAVRRHWQALLVEANPQIPAESGEYKSYDDMARDEDDDDSYATRPINEDDMIDEDDNISVEPSSDDVSSDEVSPCWW